MARISLGGNKRQLRAFVHQRLRLFLNAVIYGPGLGASEPLTW